MEGGPAHLKDLLHRVNEGIQIETGKSLKTGKLTRQYNRLTLKEKSLKLISKVVSILELQKNDWNYVKKNLNVNHIKQFYKFYGDIWRPDSDIFRYYETEKHMSFSVINVFGGTHKRILNIIFSLGVYFDGFYIFDFLKNPWFYNKQYNPISNPHYYIGDSLKDFFTLYTLKHLIALDHIKILPLPSEFITELNMEIMSLGEKNRDNIKIAPEDEQIIEKEKMEMLLSHASRAPDIKSFLENALSNKNKKVEIDRELIDLCKSLKENDPFILNQDFKKEERIIRKNGTPEITYIISRLKGIPIITNSKTIQNIFIKNLYRGDNIWSDFMNKINDYEFKMIPFIPGWYDFCIKDPLQKNVLFYMKIRGDFFKDFYLFLRDVFYCATYHSQDEKEVDRLTKELSIQLQALDDQWKRFETEIDKKNNSNAKKYIKKAKLHFTIEPKGFKMPKADKWIEKYIKNINVQKSTILIYGNLNI